MLLIFDLDGTLFEAKPVILHTAQAFARNAGVPVPEDGELLKFAGKGTAAIIRGLLPEGGDINTHRRQFGELLQTAIIRHGRLFPGVRQMLEQLHNAGHILTVCSNSSFEYISLVLRVTGILDYFKGYYSAEGYPSKTELIACLIEKNTCAAVIGDTHGDIRAARMNNLKSIAAKYGYGNKDLLADADYAAESPLEICTCVRALECGQTD